MYDAKDKAVMKYPIKIEFRTEIYRNLSREIAYFTVVDRPDMERDIVFLNSYINSVVDRPFSVVSNQALSSAKHTIAFDNYGQALAEYHKRIYEFLHYKYPPYFDKGE